MDLKKMVLALLIAVFIVSFVSVAVVEAEEGLSDYDNLPAEQVINDINSTVNLGISEGEIKYDENYTLYRLTVQPREAVVGQQVIAIAETDNRRVTHVTFLWVNPFGKIQKTETVPVCLENNLRKANSTYNPDKLGSWWVFALFENRNTSSRGCGWLFAMKWMSCRIIKFKAVIPDYPLVGTAGAMATMLMGLGLFLNKKRQKSF